METKITTYKGSRLFDWQKAVTDELTKAEPASNKTVVVKAHRQCGKSFMCMQILLYYAINYRRSISAMVSPTLNQSRAIFKELVDAIIDSGVIKSKNEMLLTIELINGSTIFFKSQEQRDALRGFHVSGILILDEAAFLLDSILPLVLPWRNVSKCPLCIVSTPLRKDGFFFRYWNYGIAKEHNTVAIDWNDYDTSALLTEEQKQQYRQILPKNQYMTEIEGQFIEGDGMVFTGILNNIGMSQNGTMLYAGIDWGSGKDNDYTCLTIFNEHGEMVYIDYFNDLGTFPQVERLVSDIKPYADKLVKIQAENNSIGNPLTDLFRKSLEEKGLGSLIGKIVEFTTTNAEKVRLVAQVQTGLELNKIKLLNDSKLINELAAYSATYNSKTGNVSYNAPAGMHDDTVIATMLGYDAYKSSNDYVQKNVVFLKRRSVGHNGR